LSTFFANAKSLASVNPFIAAKYELNFILLSVRIFPIKAESTPPERSNAKSFSGTLLSTAFFRSSLISFLSITLIFVYPPYSIDFIFLF